MLKRLAATLLLATLPLAAFAEPPAGSTWKMTFSDEFNGTALDASKWGTGYGWGSGGESDGNNQNAELQSYRKSQVKVSGGSLNLTGIKQANTLFGQNYGYASGMITSFGKFAQTGGYWEARIKFPKGNGLWGAFWLLPSNPLGKWPPEVDIVEFIGNEYDNDNLNDWQIVHTNRHYAGCTPSCQNGTIYDSKIDLTKDYHIYGADWDPDKGVITYYLDGKKINTLTGGVPKEPMYILANLALGGSWPGNPDATTKFPAVMLIDFIRVYQRQAGAVEPPTPSQPTTLNVNCSGTAREGAFTLNCQGAK